MLNRSDERAHSCLITYLGESIQFSTIKPVSYRCFIDVFYSSFSHNFFWFSFCFCSEWVLDFVKIIFCSWFFFFSLLMWQIALMTLWMLSQSCIPGINPSCAWHVILFNIVGLYLLIFCSALYICVHETYL